ncbi:MAG: TlpA family protein disulfide reductase [Paludibacteraceae bacterium]|nr:TlpA family protein disulfide reductase [Paludibacteraceae bacterium]
MFDIIHATPAAVRRSYVDKFAGTVADTALVSGLKRHYYNLLDPQITSATDLELLDINGQKTTLSKILSQSKGKALYVDFWASWCAPCLREMPMSKELRQNEKYKNTVFVYLAINDNQEQ